MKVSCSNKTTVAGFTLTELMVVVAMIGLLASLAMPGIAKARDSARLSNIYTNLRTLETAKEQWALDNNKTTGAQVASVSVVAGYIRWGGLQEVVDEVYIPNPVGTAAEADLPNTVQLGPYGPGASIPAP